MQESSQSARKVQLQSCNVARSQPVMSSMSVKTSAALTHGLRCGLKAAAASWRSSIEGHQTSCALALSASPYCPSTRALQVRSYSSSAVDCAVQRRNKLSTDAACNPRAQYRVGQARSPTSHQGGTLKAL